MSRIDKSNWGPPEASSFNDKVRLGVRPYRAYMATLTQTGSDAPVVTVIENTLGADVVWTRASTGFYEGTVTGKLIVGKSFAVPLNPNKLANAGTDRMIFYVASIDAVGLQTYSDTYSTIADALLEDTPVEIRVYN